MKDIKRRGRGRKDGRGAGVDGEAAFAAWTARSVGRIARARVDRARRSAGRLGPMVFITTETTYTNQFGQLCAIQRSTAIRY